MAQILRHGGIGMMIGEPSVHVEEEFGSLDVEPLQQLVHHWSGGAIARVEYDFNSVLEFKLRRDLVDVGIDNVHLLMRALAAQEIAILNQMQNFLDGLAMQGARAANGLESIELSRIVA